MDSRRRNIDSRGTDIDGRGTDIDGRNTTFLMIRGKKDRSGMESRRDGGINFRMFIRLLHGHVKETGLERLWGRDLS